MSDDTLLIWKDYRTDDPSSEIAKEAALLEPEDLCHEVTLACRSMDTILENVMSHENEHHENCMIVEPDKRVLIRELAFTGADFESLARLDAETTGKDRRIMLSNAATDDEATIVVAIQKNEMVGYAIACSFADSCEICIGPVVLKSSIHFSDAKEILRQVLELAIDELHRERASFSVSATVSTQDDIARAIEQYLTTMGMVERERESFRHSSRGSALVMPEACARRWGWNPEREGSC